MNAHEFSLSLDTAFAEKKNEILRFVKTVALDALSGVVKMSPVVTGRFRGNWDTSIGVASTQTFDTTTASASLERGGSALANYHNFAPVHLSNNLPYATVLENGSSSQAPNGVVAVTVARINLKYGRVEI